MNQSAKPSDDRLEGLAPIQKKLVGELYEAIREMTPEERAGLKEYHKMTLECRRRDEEKQASRLELVRTICTIKKLKVEAEKRVLQQQSERLNSL